MTNEEMLGVAEIVERATNRFNEQAARFRERSAAYDRLITDMNADHERKMAEHRAAFGPRTEADVEDLRNRLNLLGIKAAKQALGMVEGEGLLCAAKRVVKERDAQSALVAKQRHLLAEKQTEIGALEAERDDLRKIVEMVHADLGIQRGDHVGEAISELKKEASDATARQRMTEARALNYSLQADEARREIERLRAKLAKVMS